MPPVILRHIDRDRMRAVATRIAIRSTVDDQLRAMRAAVLAWVQREQPIPAEKVAKARRQKDVEDFEWEEFKRRLEEELRAMAVDGSREALEQVHEYLPALLDQANEDAVRWAAERAAELVTQIDETTREGIRAAVERALEEGESNDDLARELSESHLFSDSRALMVARSETAAADLEGNRIGWRASGVVGGREWKTDDDPCDECAPMDGEIVGIDEEFPGGSPPLHPRCECVELPVLAEEE